MILTRLTISSGGHSQSLGLSVGYPPVDCRLVRSRAPKATPVEEHRGSANDGGERIISVLARGDIFASTIQQCGRERLVA